MRRTLFVMLALAAVLAMIPGSAQAQIPIATAGSLVASQPVTDDGATSATLGGLRAFLASQFKSWFAVGGGSTASRLPATAMRTRRTLAMRSQIRVP